MRGAILVSLNRYEEAVLSYDHALGIKPNSHTAWYGRGNALHGINRFDEAIACFDRAVEIEPDDPIALYLRSSAYFAKFISSVLLGELSQAKKDWQEAIESGRRSKIDDWAKPVSIALLRVTKLEHLVLIRSLIGETNLEEEMFPLVRAIDYLQTGDEALIERLSPEVRGIVEELVDELHPIVKKTKTTKTKNKR